MILLIDNYDSFTYNLAQLLGQLGQKLVVRRNDRITLDEIAALRPDRIVISPGPCTPANRRIRSTLIPASRGSCPFWASPARSGNQRGSNPPVRRGAAHSGR